MEQHHHHSQLNQEQTIEPPKSPRKHSSSKDKEKEKDKEVPTEPPKSPRKNSSSKDKDKEKSILSNSWVVLDKDKWDEEYEKNLHNRPKSTNKHLIFNENSNKVTKACVTPPSHIELQQQQQHHHIHLSDMFKGIKDGLSHAKKDKIKIEYHLEFKKLLNLPNELVGQPVSLKWSRGKNKGETKDFKVTRQQPPATNGVDSANLSNSIPSTSSTSSTAPAKSTNVPSITITSSSQQQQTATTTTTTTNTKDSFTRKQAKMLLGNKIDGSNTVSSGDGYVTMNDKINFKVTLYSETNVSKDNSLSTNFEQKLLSITLLTKNLTLCTTTIDLSLHTEDNGMTPIDVLFPSSSSVQPSLQLAIKTNYLKYNEKKIIRASPEIIKSKDINIVTLNGANKLMEIQGEVYFIGNINKNHNSNTSSSTNSSGQNSNNQLNIPGNASDSDPHSETITRSTSWDEDTEDTFQLSTKDALARKTVEFNELSEKMSVIESQLKELNLQIEKKNNDIISLRHVIDENQIQVLAYEENAHRYKLLEERATKQLAKERTEFLQFKNTLAKEQKQSGGSNDDLTSSINKNATSFEKEFDQSKRLNETLKQELEELKAQYAEEKKSLEESNETLKLLYEDTKEKLKSIKHSLENEMKQNNSKQLQETEIRKRVTQQIDTERRVKTSQMSMKMKIFYNPYIAWAVALICFIMYISKSFSGC